MLTSESSLRSDGIYPRNNKDKVGLVPIYTDGQKKRYKMLM